MWTKFCQLGRKQVILLYSEINYKRFLPVYQAEQNDIASFKSGLFPDFLPTQLFNLDLQPEAGTDWDFEMLYYCSFFFSNKHNGLLPFEAGAPCNELVLLLTLRTLNYFHHFLHVFPSMTV